MNAPVLTFARHSIRVFGVAICLLGLGCVSVQSKRGLPEDWQAAMQPNGTADISGEYLFHGEGKLIPDDRITAFLPISSTLFPKKFAFKQVSSTRLEVHIEGDGNNPYVFEIEADPKTGEVRIPSFSKPWEEGPLPGLG
jgi:hypothetical protein